MSLPHWVARTAANDLRERVGSALRSVPGLVRNLPRRPRPLGPATGGTNPFHLVTFRSGGSGTRRNVDRTSALFEEYDMARYDHLQSKEPHSAGRSNPDSEDSGHNHSTETSKAMTRADLVTKFQAMRKNAPPGHKTAHGHLFGILFHDEIHAAGTNGTRIAKPAGTASAEVEINNGRKLATYVTVKPDVAKVWKK